MQRKPPMAPVERVIPERAGYMPDAEFDHPAFGVVELASVTCGGGVHLAGSELKHGHTMRVRVHRGYLSRDFGRNTIRQKSSMPMIEFEFSEAQWSRFVCSQGWGGGTPCTIRLAAVEGSEMEAPPDIAPPEPPQESARREAREHARTVIEQVDAARAALNGLLARPGAISKGELAAAVKGLNLAGQHFAANAEFHLQMLAEVMERTVSDAKTEVEAFVNHVAVNTGLQALRDGAAPVLLEHKP